MFVHIVIYNVTLDRNKRYLSILLELFICKTPASSWVDISRKRLTLTLSEMLTVLASSPVHKDANYHDILKDALELRFHRERHVCIKKCQFFSEPSHKWISLLAIEKLHANRDRDECTARRATAKTIRRHIKETSCTVPLHLVIMMCNLCNTV